MIYLLFASSPNQLIGIKEYIFKNKIKNFKIYILLSNNNIINNEFNRSIKFLKLKKITKIRNNKIFFVTKIKYIILIFYIFIKFRKKKLTFVIGDFLNTYFHFLRYFFKKSKFILVDDGFASFWIYHKYFLKNIYLPINPINMSKNWFSKERDILKFLINFNFLKNKKIQLFTVYAELLGLNKKSLNDLSFCKTLRKDKKIDKNLNYIIGTKYYESNLLKLNEEIELLKKIINYQKNKKYVYVVKRSTSSKKISEIKKYLNISVIYFGMPLELALLKDNRKLPKNIFSLGSGLDMTIPTLFKKINIYLINIKGLKKNKWYEHSSKFFNLFFKLDQKKKIINL